MSIDPLYQAKRNLKRDISHTTGRDPPNWGFSIYRTAYGEATDEPWEELLATIRGNVRAEVMGSQDTENEEVMQLTKEFMSLFELDDKEDRGRLEGASMDQVREYIRQTDPPRIYHERGGLISGETLTSLYDVFLVVDAEVLDRVRTATQYESWWVKAVELGYNLEEHQGNIRIPKHYWGWMKLNIESVWELWSDLGGRDISQIAPGNIDEGKLEVWNG